MGFTLDVTRVGCPHFQSYLSIKSPEMLGQLYTFRYTNTHTPMYARHSLTVWEIRRWIVDKWQKEKQFFSWLISARFDNGKRVGDRERERKRMKGEWLILSLFVRRIMLDEAMKRRDRMRSKRESARFEEKEGDAALASTKGVNMNYTALWFSSTRNTHLISLQWIQYGVNMKWATEEKKVLWWFCYLRHYFRIVTMEGKEKSWSIEFGGYFQQLCTFVRIIFSLSLSHEKPRKWWAKKMSLWSCDQWMKSNMWCKPHLLCTNDPNLVADHKKGKQKAKKPRKSHSLFHSPSSDRHIHPDKRKRLHKCTIAFAKPMRIYIGLFLQCK